MQLPNYLKPGILVKRYKRFLADIDFNGELVTVHCPNPGSMIGLSSPGLRVWCSLSNDKKRKYPYTLEIIQVGETW
jgi:DNA-binding protein, stimulates sugar fermentation